jgi:hypothetical protein
MSWKNPRSDLIGTLETILSITPILAAEVHGCNMAYDLVDGFDYKI